MEQPKHCVQEGALEGRLKLGTHSLNYQRLSAAASEEGTSALRRAGDPGVPKMPPPLPPCSTRRHCAAEGERAGPTCTLHRCASSLHLSSLKGGVRWATDVGSREKSHQLWQGEHKGSQQAQVCCERLLRHSHDIPLQMDAAHAGSILSISLQAPRSSRSPRCTCQKPCLSPAGPFIQTEYAYMAAKLEFVNALLAIMPHCYLSRTECTSQHRQLQLPLIK